MGHRNSKVIEVGLSVNKLDKKSNVRPINAFKEMIWNSCDADASNIQFSFEQDVNLEGDNYVTKIIVEDDGHGLSYEKADNAFKNFGESEKANKFVSPKGRKYHGKLGEGRYTYFALGTQIQWESVYRTQDGFKNTNILFDTNNKKKLTIFQEDTNEIKTGMTITITGILEKNYKILDKKKEIINELVSEFAGYLLAHKEIKLIFDNKPIDISKNIDVEKNYDFDNGTIQCNVKIIKWKNVKVKQRYICGIDNVVYQEDPLKTAEDNISMYVSSPYFDELKEKGIIDTENYDEGYLELIRFSDKCLYGFIKDLLSNEEQVLLKEIRADESYPFSNTNQDTIQQEQQKLFDIVAVEIAKNSPQIRNAGRQSKKLTNKLILEAIKTNPSSLKTILHEVFNLSKEKQDELAGILEHISLNNIITTMQEVSNRLIFLEELYEIVYGNSGKKMKERTEFQKILLEELWIFGDKYKYGTDDQSLRNVLKKHLKELTKDDEELTEEQRKNPELNNIPDICLWNKQKIGDRFENLIVEIKRPTKILGQKEWNQIERYAFAVSGEPGFAQTDWQFILIGKEFDNYTKTKLKSFKDNVVIDQDNIKVKILKWEDLIADNKLRYEYFKEKSQLKIEEEDVSSALNKRWNELSRKD